MLCYYGKRLFGGIGLRHVHKTLPRQHLCRPFKSQSTLCLDAVMAPGVHEPLVSNGTIVPVRILVIGGSYGGLSTISKLLSLVNKNKKLPEGQIVNRGIHVTLIDERDGFCKYS